MSVHPNWRVEGSEVKKVLFIVLLSFVVLALFSCVANQNPPNNGEPPNNPPTMPSNPKPADGETGVRYGNVVLSWVCSDPDGDELTFYVYFKKGATPTETDLATVTTQASYTVGELNLITTYYWKIVAEDDKGGKTEGPVWRFTTTSCPVCR